LKATLETGQYQNILLRWALIHRRLAKDSTGFKFFAAYLRVAFRIFPYQDSARALSAFDEKAFLAMSAIWCAIRLE
jgi:hypothetical protein